MNEWAMASLMPLGAYAAGCVNGAYYLVRLRTRQDLRALGSGNAGARNAGRVLGRPGFFAAVAFDAAKGALVVIAVRAFGAGPAVEAAAMVAVVAGHIWPAQLRFRGGKGAATALGVLAAFDPLVAVTLLAIGLLLLGATRRLMVGGFVALVLGPVVASIYGHDVRLVVGLAGVALVVVIAHRADFSATAESADAKLHDAPGTYASR
jgi:glycerol-3-phosphate acyltransferase PlsY